MELFTSNKKKSGIIFLSITSSAVRAQVYVKGDKKHKQIIGTYQTVEVTTAEVVPNIEKNLAIIAMNTLMSVNDTLSNQGIKIDVVHIIYSAPWVALYGNSQQRSFPEPTFVTEQVLGEFLKEQINTAAIQHMSVLSDHVTHWLLNGYKTSSPLSKTASEIIMYRQIVFVQTNISSLINDIVTKVFGDVEINLSTDLDYQNRSIELKRPTDFTIITITEEATSFARFQNNNFFKQETEFVGSTTLARNIAVNTKVPFTEVIQQLLSENAAAVITKNDPIQDELQPLLESLFSQAKENEAITPVSYLFSNNTLSPFFIQQLKKALQNTTLKTYKLVYLPEPIDFSTHMNNNFGE